MNSEPQDIPLMGGRQGSSVNIPSPVAGEARETTTGPGVVVTYPFRGQAYFLKES